jgi:hypothetical protein
MSTTLSTQEKVLILKHRAAHVFRREASKHAIWAGLCNPDPRGDVPLEQMPHNVFIFYDPNCSHDEVWDLLGREGLNSEEDPDGFRLELAWGRKVKVSRIFGASLESWEYVQALFLGGTVYGDFNNPILRNLRAAYYREMRGCQLLAKLNGSVELVKNLMNACAAKQSLSSPEASKRAYEIANTLKIDTVYSSLHPLVETPRKLAEDLGKIGSHDPSWPKALERLFFVLCDHRTSVSRLSSFADKICVFLQVDNGGRVAQRPA